MVSLGFLRDSFCDLLSKFTPMISGYFFTSGGRVVFYGFDLLSSWIGITVELRNPEKLYNTDEIVVFVANHQSALDSSIIARIWPKKCTVMVKKSLAYVPALNLVAFLSNVIFVDRFNPTKAKQAIESAVETILRKKMKLWVFPEGTRFQGRGMLPFKKGAFNIAVEAQIPIIPVVISHYGCFYSIEKKYFKSNGQVIVQVLDSIPTKGVSFFWIKTALRIAISSRKSICRMRLKSENKREKKFVSWK